MQKETKQKKILFVLEHFHPYIGGAENLFRVLTTGLVKSGYAVSVVTTRFDKALPSREIFEGVQIIRVSCINRFAFTLFSLPKVYKHAKAADFIHTTTYNAALPAALIGKLLRKPVFITFHEVWGQLWKALPFISFFEKNSFYLFEKIILKLPFTAFIAVSDFTKDALIEHGIAAHKVHRIYNGIDYAQLPKHEVSTPKQFTFTYFGRLGISKGLNILLPAAAVFREKYPKTRVRLILPKYPAPLYEKVLHLVQKYRLEEYIEWHHNLTREELFRQLQSSSCVVIPSYSEGFCFAAAEAVGLGVPIISSQQGALSETVSGKYIPVEAMSVEALSIALEKAYLNNWEEKPIQHFHLSDSLKAYLDFYKNSSSFL